MHECRLDGVCGARRLRVSLSTACRRWFYCRFCKFIIDYSSKVEWKSTYVLSVSFSLGRCWPYRLVMGPLTLNQFEGTTRDLERLNKNEPTWFHLSILSCSSCSYRSFSETRLPDRPSSRWRWLASRCSFTDCLAVKTGGLRPHQNQPGNDILIPNMKRSSAERNVVNVVLIDERLHHCMIVIHSRLRTREEPGPPGSAENMHSMIHRYRKRKWTNERTILNDSSW